MFRVMGKGMLTSVQDPKRRNGYQCQGFPPTGVMDDLAMTVGNILVGNDPNEAGLEFAFNGPELLFLDDALAAVTGVPTSVFVDGAEVPMWEAVLIRKGQILSVKSKGNMGQWGCISISGGIDVPPFMGSKSTFAFCGAGGFQGRLLAVGDIVPTGSNPSLSNAGKKLRGRYIPALTSPMLVELMDGYYLDYLSDRDLEMMFTSTWRVLPNSNRMGYRLSGPAFEFSEKARNKDKEAGSHPSNIFDTGYPLYSINLCGDTPVISTPEAMTCGGYFCPFSIPTAAQWKIAQCRIGTDIRFRYVTMEGAARLREEYDMYLLPDYYTT